MIDHPAVERGIAISIVPDIRWKRCDIKSIGLLAQVLAKQSARNDGAQDAWMVDIDGMVTEGASINAFIVSEGSLSHGNLRTTFCTESLGKLFCSCRNVCRG